MTGTGVLVVAQVPYKSPGQNRRTGHQTPGSTMRTIYELDETQSVAANLLRPSTRQRRFNDR